MTVKPYKIIKGNKIYFRKINFISEIELHEYVKQLKNKGYDYEIFE